MSTDYVAFAVKCHFIFKSGKKGFIKVCRHYFIHCITVFVANVQRVCFLPH